MVLLDDHLICEAREELRRRDVAVEREGDQLAKINAEEKKAAERRKKVAAELAAEVAAETEWFWTYHPTLTALRDGARLHRASPWGALGILLARVAAAIPPHVVLPPLVGGHGSLNTFVALIGGSGDGKGAAGRAVRSIVRGLPDTPSQNIGSGEGLVRAYGHRHKDPTDTDTYKVTDTFLLDAPEIDSFMAVSGRAGATVSSILRQAWSGEALGFQYADATKAAQIPDMSYRLGVIVGVQPLRAGKFLEEHGGGLPQRFVFLPVNDKAATRETRTALREQYGTTPPHVDLSGIVGRWALADPFAAAGAAVTDEDGNPLAPVFHRLDERDMHALEVGPAAVAAIDEDADRRLARDITDYGAEDDELSGHRTFLRLKTAAVLSVIVGQDGHVTDDAWQLAGAVLAESDRGVAGIRSVLERESQKQSAAVGKRNAQISATVADQLATREDAQRAAVTAKVRMTLDNGQWHRLRDVRYAVASTRRNLVPDVLAEMVADGDAEERAVGRTTEYRLIPNS
ncbi:DUF3987 domain-containing protein [Rhodococcus rhodochrous]|uniref:DUF3987 domain-containing protein n=1 Tax=Rhodococcus rhodochrous TaxID=1829 RepID=UPI001E3BC806|nr:DUF3987 domain-containing protein [Rhodococcus rhodochrous]MCB8912201.1 DUF3987 domain-containing protein [Rhodococcus rhodochrous]